MLEGAKKFNIQQKEIRVAGNLKAGNMVIEI
jgi:hypothetical protein